MQIHSYSHHLHPIAFISSAPFLSQSKPKTKPKFHPKPSPHKKPLLTLFSSNKTNPHAQSQSQSQSTTNEPLELLSKPEKPDDPTASSDPNNNKPTDEEEFSEALAPFLKFFTSDSESDSNATPAQIPNIQSAQHPDIQYYDPKRGDFVVGVVVSGNENKLDVNVGADYLGTMLTKEVLPMYGKELDYLLCDVNREKEEGGIVRGKMGVVRDEEALSREKVEGRPVVEVGTVVFAEVMGRTLSGRPLLSSRRMYRRVAWHRVRQVLGSFYLFLLMVVFDISGC